MSKVRRVVEGIVRAAATPVSFSIKTGHAWSSVLGRSVDDAGSPIPTFTYPALEVLHLLDLSDASVLEWGTGQSTLYFSKRVRRVVGIEASTDWAQYVRKHTDDNVEMYVCRSVSDLRLVRENLLDVRFEVTVIDGIPYSGGSRCEAAEMIFGLPCTPKLIIVDNADLLEGRRIVSSFTDQGFTRADFVGYSPGAYHRQCTSFLFRPEDASWALGNDAPVPVCSPLSDRNGSQIV